MKYELRYKGTVVFRRFYEDSVRSKDKHFLIEIKKEFKQILVPSFEKARKYNSQFHRMHEMIKQDLGGSFWKEKIKTKIERIDMNDKQSIDLENYLTNKRKNWDSEILTL